jgi:excisionase family DNA binding protein
MPTEIMTVDDLAAYLRIDRQTVYRKFRRGELPGVRIGRAIRFKREVVDGWLRTNSMAWGEAQREELRAAVEQFAKDRKISEADVIKAVRRVRRSR